MTNQQLINLAHAAGKELYGNGLVFDAAMCRVKVTTYEEEVQYLAELAECQCIAPEVVQFSDFDYVFFPVSNKPPMDVAGRIYLDDPQVYDVDGNCYCYSGKADAVYVMKRKEKP